MFLRENVYTGFCNLVMNHETEYFHASCEESADKVDGMLKFVSDDE